MHFMLRAKQKFNLNFFFSLLFCLFANRAKIQIVGKIGLNILRWQTTEKLFNLSQAAGKLRTLKCCSNSITRQL